jgi:hypothetical protein
VLVDVAAMDWALASAIAAQRGMWALAITLALVAGSMKETAPIFASCYAWNPVLLVGLACPLVRKLTAAVGDDIFDDREAWVLAHPILASRIAHAGRWRDPSLMLTPWGVSLIALFTIDHAVLIMLLTTLVLAYCQLLIATDSVRLYQWAAPPMILATMTVLTSPWAIVALALHLLNPWAGDGA